MAPSPSKLRRLAFRNRMALKQLRICHTSHKCELCVNNIQIGSEYRGDRDGDRAHESCLKAVRGTFRETGNAKEEGRG